MADRGPGLDALPEGDWFVPLRAARAEALGVGLAISRTAVEPHGGTIEAAPGGGGGAIFRMPLPRAAPPG